MQQPKTVGIYGGGQLALMLIQNAPADITIRCAVFHTEEPVARVFPAIIDHVRDEATLDDFLEKIDLLLFENEFIKPEHATILERKKNIRFVPSLKAIQNVSNKLYQKQKLAECGIPTSPFVIIDPQHALEEVTSSLFDRFPQGFVLKWSKLGYDGYGVLVCQRPTLQKAVLDDFINRSRGCPIYAEEWIPFEKEIALVAAHHRGEMAFLPTVVTHQIQGRCSEARAPASLFGFDGDAQAQAIAKRVANVFELEGVFAVEFFYDVTRGLLVNEIAPRVHNSAHFSIDGSTINQFELHWKAALGEPLEHLNIQTRPTIMLNLLGPIHGPIFPPQVSCGTVHWYHKLTSQVGRKLGHINVVGSDRDDALRQLQIVKEELKKWSHS